MKSRRYKSKSHRNFYTRHKQPYSVLRRSGIGVAIGMLGIYALLQVFMPHWMESVPNHENDVRFGNKSYEQPTTGTLSGHGSVLRITDGDTIILHGQRIRLKGIDTPELQQKCQLRGNNYPCGSTATDALRKLIGNETVTCTDEGKDRYNRILAFCKAGQIDINRTLVEQGWAVSYGLYQREEAQARKNKRGLWAGEFERPSKWRKNNK